MNNSNLDRIRCLFNNGFNFSLVLYAIVSPISTSALYIASGMIVLFGIGLLIKKENRRIEINRSVIVLYATLFLWGWFTAAFAGDYLYRDAFAFAWEYIFIILLPLFLQAASVRKEKVVAALLISSSLICLLGIIQYLFPSIVYPFPRQLIQRGSFHGFFHTYNPAASFFGLIAIVAFSLLLFLDISKKYKVALLLFFALTLIAVVLSMARNGYISVFTILIMLFLKNRQWFIYGLVSFVVLLIIILSFSNPFSSRLKTLTDSKYSSNIDRIEMWKLAVEIFKEHPVVGVGKRNWGKSLAELKSNPQKWHISGDIETFVHPHNIYLQSLAETGIIGLILFVSFWGNILRLLCLRNTQVSKGSFESALTIGVIGCLGNLFISNMFDVFLGFFWILLLISFMIGLSLSSSPDVKYSTRNDQ